MSNYAWVLEVRPGYEEEYKKRHDELWPEMKEMLSDAGIRNYNIFRHGLTLFGYFETDDLQKSIKHITESEINKTLETLTKNKTTITIAHRLSTIINSDQIILISKGKIVDVGSHKELVKSSDYYKKLYVSEA